MKVDRKLSRRACLCVGSLAASARWLVGCAPDEFGAPLARGRHVTVYGRTPSAAAVDETDRYVEWCAATLGVELPPMIHYYWAPQSVDPQSTCQGIGYAHPEVLRITADALPHDHELVHIVSAPLGRPPLVMVEGLAEALSRKPDYLCSGFPRVRPKLPPPWFSSQTFRAVLAYQHIELLFREDPYVLAGLFMRGVIARWGMEKCVQFYRSLDHFADWLEVRRAFVGATGASLDEALEFASTGNPALFSLLG